MTYCTISSADTPVDVSIDDEFAELERICRGPHPVEDEVLLDEILQAVDRIPDPSDE